MKRYGGGALNNSGPHFIDMGMLLIDDPEPTVFCHMETTPLYAGDADSHVKSFSNPSLSKGRWSRSTLQPPAPSHNRTSWCWARKDLWSVTATKRAGDTSTPAEAPPMILDEAPIARDRTYNRQQLVS